MHVSIVSLFKELYEPFLHTSLIKSAQQKGLVSFQVDSLFSFAPPKKRVDAPAYAPGAGMVLKPEVVQEAILAGEQSHGSAYKIFFSPQGTKLDQVQVRRIATRAQKAGHVMLLPARYEGMDARVEQVYADEIISIGDYVLMGGDIPAMALLEALLRYVPGVVGDSRSVEHDSFTGPFVDYPSYTEPVQWHGLRVPDVLRSGNHKAIEQWRTQQAVSASVRKHFAWTRSQVVTQEQKKLVATHMPPHYVALMHTDVLVGKDREPGTTSVTSLDIHDIARTSRTYGVRGYHIVTPLADQTKIVNKLLSFWRSDAGIQYNPSRHEAVKDICLAESLEQVIAAIEEKEGKKPLLVATSARSEQAEKIITYKQQEVVWSHERPVLFIFGTGQGLSAECIARCDYLLVPVEGFSDFNHLSVRSAVAIILDRWLGMQPDRAYSADHDAEGMVEKR